MRLISYQSASGKAEAGILNGDAITPLAPLGYADALSFISAGDEALAKARAASGATIPAGSVKLLAPIQDPPRIFAIGLNYQAHALESKNAVQKVPTVFMKMTSAVIGPGDEIILPKASNSVDYEAELAIVIGKGGYQISEADALQHVFGYTNCNDVSARDVQKATTQWTLGKSFPTFAPLGPAIVTSDEIGDPHTLGIRCFVAGEKLQDSNTRDMIFKVPQIIAYISGITPLFPGDIISTGTPEGVGMGRTPYRWLKPGEGVVVEIDKIGRLENTTVAEK